MLYTQNRALNIENIYYKVKNIVYKILNCKQKNNYIKFEYL